MNEVSCFNFGSEIQDEHRKERHELLFELSLIFEWEVTNFLSFQEQ